MTVAELIEILKTMPQNLPIEINDNMGGQIIYIDSVDHFDLEGEDDYPVVMIQANVYEDRVVEDCEDEWPEAEE
jgi:hypothetical protein